MKVSDWDFCYKNNKIFILGLNLDLQLRERIFQMFIFFSRVIFEKVHILACLGNKRSQIMSYFKRTISMFSTVFCYELMVLTASTRFDSARLGSFRLASLRPVDRFAYNTSLVPAHTDSTHSFD